MIHNPRLLLKKMFKKCHVYRTYKLYCKIEPIPYYNLKFRVSLL